MSSGYHFVHVDQHNTKDLRELFINAYETDFDKEFIDRKLNTSAFGLSYIGFIIYTDDQQAVGFYAMYPCEIMYNGVKYLAAQQGDLMIHKDHRGKGLYTQVANMLHNYIRELGVNLFFGFPNENSFPGFVKNHQWNHYDDFQIYLIRVRTIPWIRLKKMFRLPSSLHQAWGAFVLNLIPPGSYFQNSVIEDNVGGIDHSESFFRYKQYKKSYIVKVAGKNVWLKFDDDFLLIGDIERCSEQEFLAVIVKLKKLAFILGLHHLRYQCGRGAHHEQHFVHHGKKMEKTYPIGGVNLTNIVPLSHIKFGVCDNDGY